MPVRRKKAYKVIVAVFTVTCSHAVLLSVVNHQQRWFLCGISHPYKKISSNRKKWDFLEIWRSRKKDKVKKNSFVPKNFLCFDFAWPTRPSDLQHCSLYCMPVRIPSEQVPSGGTAVVRHPRVNLKICSPLGIQSAISSVPQNSRPGAHSCRQSVSCLV